MIPRNSRTVWALALALAVVGGASRDARAGAITYGTTGWVDTPAGGTPTLVSYTGTTGTVVGIGSLNLGQFVVTPTAQAVDFTGDPFHIIVYSGPNQSELLTGTLSGSVGTGVTTPLTATINSVMPFGSSPLPFTLNVPTGVAMALNTGSSTGTSTTIFSAGASPIPEPTSVAVFAAALSGLALWRRRAAR